MNLKLSNLWRIIFVAVVVLFFAEATEAAEIAKDIEPTPAELIYGLFVFLSAITFTILLFGNEVFREWVIGDKNKFTPPSFGLEQMVYALLLTVLIPTVLALTLKDHLHATAINSISSALLLCSYALLMIFTPSIFATEPKSPSIPSSFSVSFSDFLRGAIVALPLAFFTGLLVLLVRYFLYVLFGIAPDIHPAILSLSSSELPERLQIVLMVLVFAPLIEELLFRGLLFGSLAKYMSFKKAAVLTSLLFALVHPTIGDMVGTFVLSFGLIVLYKRTGSLIAPIAAHATFNTVSVIGTLI